MEIPDNMINHIKESAKTIRHGTILIKLDETRDIIDVSVTHVHRTHLKKKNKINEKSA